MNAEQKLALAYGITLRKNSGGVLLPHAWTEQGGGQFAPVSLAAGSEASTLLEHCMTAANGQQRDSK